MPYRVSLERVFPSSPLATPLGYGGPPSAVYRLTSGVSSSFNLGAADSTVQIQVTRTGGGNFPCLELIDPDGVFQDQGGLPPRARSEVCGLGSAGISPTLTKSGTYTTWCTRWAVIRR